jgi:hypothetical protein
MQITNMSKQTTSNPLSLAFILVLIVALIGAMFLVGQKQETRRGAYFSGASLLLQPDTITTNVGNDVPVQLFVQTDNVTNTSDPARVSGIDTKICYGAGLKLDATDVATLIDINEEAFKVIELAKDSNSCLRLAVVSSGIAPENLKSGLVRVATIRFKAVSEATGKLQMSLDTSKVAGYNPVPGASDTTMKVANVAGANYTIVGTGGTVAECGWCGQTCTRLNPDDNCLDVLPPAGKKCVEENGACVIKDITTVQKYTKENCNTGTGKYTCVAGDTGEFASLSDCQDAAGCEIAGTNKYTKGSCNTATGKYSCTASTNGEFATLSECQDAAGCEVAASGDSVWLKFRMSFLGVTPGNMCAEPNDMRLKVSVLASDGTTKTYDNVVPVKVDNSDGNLAYYDVSLQLTGFNYKSNVAVFVKGPKHLQGKFGVDNQAVYYDKAGGELSGLTSDEATTKVFHFEKYPLLAGDVTGEDDVQDGKIDGLDFSAVKAEAGKRTAVDEGTTLLTDLNGNCQMESQDLALLMYSLREKQGQMY